MSVGIPALLVEGISLATGADRGRIRDAIDAFHQSLAEDRHELSRRISHVLASDDSPQERFEAVASIGDSIIPTGVKSKMFGAIAAGVMGGLIWSAGMGVMGTLVALCLFAVAGYLALSVTRYAIGLLEQEWVAVRGL
jgi:hypothetical protein